MRLARVEALRGTTDGPFTLVLDHEWYVLESLDGWAVRLFALLVRASNFHTGAGQCTYAYLVAGMQPIQPRRGPKLYAPDTQAVKKMVRKFEARRIVARDRAHSQASQSLFFIVSPRVAEVRPKRKLEPQSRTPVDSRKARNGAASSPI